jgi:hypothetical protein
MSAVVLYLALQLGVTEMSVLGRFVDEHRPLIELVWMAQWAALSRCTVISPAAT